LIPRDEELHDQLMDAFREYYKANQDWLNKGTRRAGIDVRNALNRIKHLTIARRKVIMDWRYELDAEKFERRRQKEAQQKARPDKS
jgi:hypothetical protein